MYWRITAVFLALGSQLVAAQEIGPPEPLVIHQGVLQQMRDGTMSYSTRAFVQETRVSRVILRPDGLVCEEWRLDGETQQLVRGKEACESIFGDRADEVLAVAEQLASSPRDVQGPAWTCYNNAVLEIEEYSSCRVVFIEYDEEGNDDRTERVFSFDELDYQACVNWCMTHWQEDGYLGDLVMHCGGGHEVGDHPGYVPPEG